MILRKKICIAALAFLLAVCAVFVGAGTVSAVSGREYADGGTISAFSVGEGSSVRYGEHSYAPGAEGAVASLRSGDSLRYNRAVDVSDNTYDDTLISLFITPSVIGNYDFSSLNIKIEDAYDSSNYILVNAYRYYYEDFACYVKAAVPGIGQELTGKDPGPGDVWVGGVFGQYNLFSFSGTPQPDKATNIGDDVLDIRMDYEEKIIYAVRYNDPFWSFVIDLDDDTYFEETWDGFTTGEVFISVYCEEYTGSSAGIVVRNIDGQDLSEDTVTDSGKPVITVDYDGYEGDIPQALVGNPYPVFGASAYDVYCGETEVTRKVFLGEKEYPIGEDGAFVPDTAGEYTIVYTAQDAYGNTATEEVAVTAAAATPDLSLTLDRSGADDAGYVGESVTVASYTAGGGSGRVDVQAEAVLKDGTVRYPVTDSAFKPFVQGVYTVRYTAKDYTGKTLTEEYDIQIDLKEDPIFDSEPQFPICFISGKSYELPSLSAVDYYTQNGTPVEVEAEITYVDDFGEFKAFDNVIIPLKKQNGSVLIRYTATTASGSETLEFEVPVQVTENAFGGLELENYFMLDNVSASAQSDHILFSAREEGASLRFIRETLARNFAVRFNVDPAQANFGRVDILLTDYENRDVSVLLSVHKDQANPAVSYLSVNNGRRYQTVGAFDGSSSYPFSLSFNVNDNTFTDGVSTTVGVSRTLSGDAFTGFPSGKVYIEIGFGEVIGLSAIRLSSLCSQVFGSFSIDTLAPNVVVEGDYGGTYALNAEVTLPTAYAMDVLDPNPKVTMTVTDPEGNVVTSTNGYRLENIVPDRQFSIALSAYGRYLVVFTATDASGQSNSNTRYMIYCTDNAAPEFTLTGEVPASGQIGREVTLPQVQASDNYTQEPIVHISYVDPLGRVLNASDYTFVPTAAGIYRITYSVSDEQGNIVMQTYELEVKD